MNDQTVKEIIVSLNITDLKLNITGAAPDFVGELEVKVKYGQFSLKPIIIPNIQITTDNPATAILSCSIPSGASAIAGTTPYMKWAGTTQSCTTPTTNPLLVTTHTVTFDNQGMISQICSKRIGPNNCQNLTPLTVLPRGYPSTDLAGNFCYTSTTGGGCINPPANSSMVPITGGIYFSGFGSGSTEVFFDQNDQPVIRGHWNIFTLPGNGYECLAH